MQKNEINRYGNLCVEMYEILHREAPSDELNFYLSYAQAGKKILEPLCASGRFLVPSAQKGLDIFGVDSSREMLDRLQAKYPAQNLPALRLKISKRRINSTIYL